jgi:hypothetical protein
MRTQAKRYVAECSNRETEEEIADVLTAISVVSKRLARMLIALSQQDKHETKGGKADEKDG